MPPPTPQAAAAKKRKKPRAAASNAQKSAAAQAACSNASPATSKSKTSVDTRVANDIDEIFGTLTARKEEREAVRQAKAADQAAAAKEAQKRKKQRRSNMVCDNVFGEAYDLNAVIDPQNAKVHRVDRDSGFNVYKAHHLGLGRGGGTPLCPFDCKCCF